MSGANEYEVLIVGGGPAGLNAALILGRCGRRILLCDAGHPRNAASHGMHGYLSRDGIDPRELLRLGREEIARYHVEYRAIEVVAARCVAGGGFEIKLADGLTETGRKLLLATGVRDILPAVPGFREIYGRSAHHCPYCDGFEWRGAPIAVYGQGRQGVGLALKLKTWSDDVVLCTDGPARLTTHDRAQLRRQKITIIRDRVARFEQCEGRLECVSFVHERPLPRRALFFNCGQDICGDLASRLGCEVTPKHGVRKDRRQHTEVPGLWVAGDASRDTQFVIVAAAEGAVAGVAINAELQAEEGLKADADAAPAPVDAGPPRELIFEGGSAQPLPAGEVVRPDQGRAGEGDSPGAHI